MSDTQLIKRYKECYKVANGKEPEEIINALFGQEKSPGQVIRDIEIENYKKSQQIQYVPSKINATAKATLLKYVLNPYIIGTTTNTQYITITSVT